MNIKIIFALAVSMMSSLAVAQSSSSFGTLFTTASERAIIDANRYKKRRLKPASVAKIEVEEPEEIVYKTIEKEYKISGISIANNGIDSAWINGKLLEHGDSLDKKTKLSIYAKQKKIRFTVKGGKTFYGQSGDTVKVSYKVRIFE